MKHPSSLIHSHPLVLKHKSFPSVTSFKYIHKSHITLFISYNIINAVFSLLSLFSFSFPFSLSTKKPLKNFHTPQKVTWPTSEQLELDGLVTPPTEFMVLQMTALSFAMAAIFTHIRVFAFVSFILSISHIANMKMYKIRSFKDIFSSLAGPLMAIFMSYVGKQAVYWH